MLIRRSFKTLVLFLLASSVVFMNSVLAAPGDFDGDEKSDLSVALVDRNSGTTAWLTRLSSGLNPLFWTFNKAADALVAGRFYQGNSKYYPAIIRVTSTAVPLEWTFKTATNTEIETRFGLPGDTITNLGDWDGDGRDDMNVVRVEGSNQELQWFVFLTGAAAIVKVPFGLVGDQVGVSDVDNDGQAELVALRNGFTWYIRKPFANASTTTAVQWGLNGDRPLLPRDIDGDNLPDYMITRVVGANQVVYIRYGNGQTQTRTLGQASSIPQVGEFGTNSNFAWSQRDTGWAAIGMPDSSNIDLFRFGISTNIIIRPDGTVVQPTSDATFGATSTGGGSDPDDGDTGGGSEGGSFSGCREVINTPANGTFIYKQSAPLRAPGHGPIIGFRKQPTLIMNRNVSSRGTSTIYDSRGNAIGRCPWATADGHPGGRFRCTMETSTLRRTAISNTGSPTIFFTLNGTQCARVADAGRCVGSVKGLCDRLIQ